MAEEKETSRTSVIECPTCGTPMEADYEEGELVQVVCHLCGHFDHLGK